MQTLHTLRPVRAKRPSRAIWPDRAASAKNNGMLESASPSLLFAYGTLQPRKWTPGDPVWTPDAVRGLLYDLGPYPALIRPGDRNAPWVEGFVRRVQVEELTHRLDPYEGVAERLFERVSTRTRAGLWVWVYCYAQPLPPNASGPLTAWKRTGPKPKLNM